MLEKNKVFGCSQRSLWREINNPQGCVASRRRHQDRRPPLPSAGISEPFRSLGASDSCCGILSGLGLQLTQSDWPPLPFLAGIPVQRRLLKLVLSVGFQPTPSRLYATSTPLCYERESGRTVVRKHDCVGGLQQKVAAPECYPAEDALIHGEPSAHGSRGERLSC